MARTFRNLWPQIISWDNLLLAYRRCRRRKRFKRAAARFHFHWEEQLLRLQAELREHAWQPGAYHNFRIRDPKPRLISAAPFRDRIVHHAIVNVLEPIFERRFIHDSYACRRGKGTHRAIRRAQYYLRRHPWYLKTDIVRFFPNVDHDILRQQIRRIIADPHILQLVDTVLTSGEGVLAGEASQHWFPGDDLLAPLRPRGLPIGNLTSQFFANVLLDPIDHHVKEDMRVPGYLRYADDLLLFGGSKAFLRDVRDRLREAMADVRLRLHPDKTVIAPTRHGVNYLGFRVFSDQIRLNQASIARFHRHRRHWMRRSRAGTLSAHDVGVSIRAWLAHVAHCNGSAMTRTLLSRLRLRFPQRRG